MKKHHINLTQNYESEQDFDNLYDEISHDWQGKARKLQARRWRALKHSVKGYQR